MPPTTTTTSRFRIPFIKGEHPPASKDNTYKFPPTRGDGTLSLADIVGKTAAAEIEATTSIQFHTAGDTGHGPHSAQQDVAEAMARDVDADRHHASPAFMLHLGDVIYGDGKEDIYDDEFYRPYADYPNKIIAIPGNHDGEVGINMDKVSLQAFIDNFCAPTGTQPAFAKTFNCQMVNQPGVYWMLETKLMHLIGLYSNAAEDAGTLGDKNVGTHQLDWLLATLTKISKARAKGDRRALIVAMHHPPYTGGFQSTKKGHSSSVNMQGQLDGIFTNKDVALWPDLVLSGHAHNYQRYARTVTASGKSKEVPYVVVGTGGFAIQPAPAGAGTVSGDVKYVVGSPPKGLVPPNQTHMGFGYATVTVKKKSITLQFVIVQGTHRQPFETVTIPLG